MLEPQDHLAILALCAEYNRSLDAGEAAAWAATFTEDGVFHHPARSYASTAELRRFAEERTAKFDTNPIADQRHWNDPVVLSGDGDRASGSCNLLVAGVDRESGRPAVVARGRYEDRLVKTSAGWRFAERRLTIQ